VPHTAFASVNQSARWNSRIIENGLFGGLEFVMAGRIYPFIKPLCRTAYGFDLMGLCMQAHSRRGINHR
jgi:hypothetical protein